MFIFIKLIVATILAGLSSLGAIRTLELFDKDSSWSSCLVTIGCGIAIVIMFI